MGEMHAELLALAVGATARVLAYAALVALAFAPLERVLALRERAPSSALRLRCDALFATAGALVVEALHYVVLGALLALADALGPGGPLRELPALPRVAVALLLFELGGYGYHRLAHAWAPLWRLHAIHHTSTTMDWLASFRQHPLEIALMTAAQNLPLVLLGMPLGGHAVLVLALRLATVFVHADLRTPRALALVIATPDFHHRHHDRDAPPANYASLFPWIDRLFGTFDPRAAQRFGLAEPMPERFMELLVAPFRRDRIAAGPGDRSHAAACPRSASPPPTPSCAPRSP